VTRRSGLGRGLDALIPRGDGVTYPEGRSAPNEIPVEAIDPNPRQPRTSFDDEAIGDLARSITELGILQPLLVRALDERFELIAGERRLRAARRAGLEFVPAMIVETDDRGSLERALVENLHREDLNPIEEAEGYKQLIEEAGLTHEALAERLGRSRVAITNALRLLELPRSLQRQLVEGEITAGHGRALLGLQGSPFQQRLARRIGRDGLSVRETEELVRRYGVMSAGGRARATASERPALVGEAQQSLSDYLQTRVRVEMRRRRGKIVLDFVSLEELERLLKVITKQESGGEAVTVVLDH
jgi:ParB family transcriptional regulator, chromosome partitioning protein